MQEPLRTDREMVGLAQESGAEHRDGRPRFPAYLVEAVVLFSALLRRVERALARRSVCGGEGLMAREYPVQVFVIIDPRRDALLQHRIGVRGGAVVACQHHIRHMSRIDHSGGSTTSGVDEMETLYAASITALATPWLPLDHATALPHRRQGA